MLSIFIPKTPCASPAGSPSGSPSASPKVLSGGKGFPRTPAKSPLTLDHLSPSFGDLTMAAAATRNSCVHLHEQHQTTGSPTFGHFEGCLPHSEATAAGAARPLVKPAMDAPWAGALWPSAGPPGRAAGPGPALLLGRVAGGRAWGSVDARTCSPAATVARPRGSARVAAHEEIQVAARHTAALVQEAFLKRQQRIASRGTARSLQELEAAAAREAERVRQAFMERRQRVAGRAAAGCSAP